MTEWFVYILLCADRTYYCGITKDIRARVREHNTGARGSHYTRARRPNMLIFSVGAFTHSDAAKLEYRLKRVRRPRKEEFMRLKGKLWRKTQAGHGVLFTYSRLPKE